MWIHSHDIRRDIDQYWINIILIFFDIMDYQSNIELQELTSDQRQIRNKCKSDCHLIISDWSTLIMPTASHGLMSRYLPEGLVVTRGGLDVALNVVERVVNFTSDVVSPPGDVLCLPVVDLPGPSVLGAGLVV